MPAHCALTPARLYFSDISIFPWTRPCTCSSPVVTNTATKAPTCSSNAWVVWTTDWRSVAAGCRVLAWQKLPEVCSLHVGAVAFSQNSSLLRHRWPTVTWQSLRSWSFRRRRTTSTWKAWKVRQWSSNCRRPSIRSKTTSDAKSLIVVWGDSTDFASVVIRSRRFSTFLPVYVPPRNYRRVVHLRKVCQRNLHCRGATNCSRLQTCCCD